MGTGRASQWGCHATYWNKAVPEGKPCPSLPLSPTFPRRVMAFSCLLGAVRVNTGQDYELLGSFRNGQVSCINSVEIQSALWFVWMKFGTCLYPACTQLFFTSVKLIPGSVSQGEFSADFLFCCRAGIIFNRKIIMFPVHCIFALTPEKDCHPLLPTGALADWQEQNSHDFPLIPQAASWNKAMMKTTQR